MQRCSHCDHFNSADVTNCERCGGPLVDGGASNEAPASVLSYEAEVLVTAQESGKIQAIKKYRELTGQGLKESKEAVEALLEREGIVPNSNSGCSAMLIVLMIATATVFFVYSLPLPG